MSHVDISWYVWYFWWWSAELIRILFQSPRVEGFAAALYMQILVKAHESAWVQFLSRFLSSCRLILRLSQISKGENQYKHIQTK